MPSKLGPVFFTVALSVSAALVQTSAHAQVVAPEEAMLPAVPGTLDAVEPLARIIVTQTAVEIDNGSLVARLSRETGAQQMHAQRRSVVALTAGAIASPHSSLGDLRSALHAEYEFESRAAGALHINPPAALNVYVDARTPASTVLRILAVARGQGYLEFRLVAHGDAGIGALSFDPPCVHTAHSNQQCAELAALTALRGSDEFTALVGGTGSDPAPTAGTRAAGPVFRPVGHGPAILRSDGPDYSVRVARDGFAFGIGHSWFESACTTITNARSPIIVASRGDLHGLAACLDSARTQFHLDQSAAGRSFAVLPDDGATYQEALSVAAMLQQRFHRFVIGMDW